MARNNLCYSCYNHVLVVTKSLNEFELLIPMFLFYNFFAKMKDYNNTNDSVWYMALLGMGILILVIIIF
jgi:hypothetical protein